MRGSNTPGQEDRGMAISATARLQGWEMFMVGEREALVGRATGRLAYALRTTLPGESREELDRLIEEDRRLAQAGLVSLVADEGTISYKPVDELTPEDMPARRRAETARLDWLMERTDRRLELLGVKLNRPGNMLAGSGSPVRMPLGDVVEGPPASLGRGTAGY
jgi:hypothetical protein